MGLGGVMNKALTGLQVTQAGLDVVSQNISNADAVGYIKRRVSVVEQNLGDRSGGARVSGIERMLDKVVQRQLWSETAGAGYTSARANTLSALDSVYGAPSSAQSLGAVFGRFTQSLQQLKGDPSNYTLRTGVLTSAQEMAVKLRELSSGVQDLRTQAEDQIAAGVTRVNELLQQLQNANRGVISGGGQSTAAPLRDERDRIVTELARYLDIRTTESADGALNVFTTSGVSLFNGITATRLSFDPAASVGADQLWNANPALSGVGTIRVMNDLGGGYDMIADGALRSGELAALVELRDKTLVQAQNQLDEFAANMASALSDRENNGVAVTAGAATGFDVDIATPPLQPGNQITLDYTDSTTGFTGRFTFVMASGAAIATTINNAGLSASDNRVFGIDTSGGPGSIATQIGAILGAGFTVSNAGSVLRIVDDGAGNTRDVNAVTSRPSATSALPSAGGPVELPFFTDPAAANGVYTGSFEDGAPQSRGFAARIEVNSQLLADRNRLVQYQTTPMTQQGDSTRPDMLYSRLTSQTRYFSPQTGLGGTAAAYKSNIANFTQRVVETQSATISNAKRLDEGQQIALKSVQGRFSETSGVSVDQEMANLVELQNAYAANARVISAVREMIDMLMRI